MSRSRNSKRRFPSVSFQDINIDTILKILKWLVIALVIANVYKRVIAPMMRYMGFNDNVKEANTATEQMVNQNGGTVMIGGSQVGADRINSDAAMIKTALGLPVEYMNPWTWSEDEDRVIEVLTGYTKQAFKALSTNFINDDSIGKSLPVLLDKYLSREAYNSTTWLWL